LSDQRLKGKLLSLVEAKEVKLFQNRDKEGNLEIIEHEIPALGIQQKSLDMAFKIKGLYQADKIDTEGIQDVLANIHKARGNL